MAYLESLQTSLTPSQWVSFFAVLPTESEMASGDADHAEIAAAIVTKAIWGVSFAYTPATKHPRLLDIVSRPSGSAIDLSARFREEGTTDKGDSLLNELELAPSDDWSEGGESGSVPTPFTPSSSQWNQVVKRIGGLSQELKDARQILSLLAEESDNHLEVLDDQVTNIRVSVGRRPAVLSTNVPGMELWMSVSSLADTLQGVRKNMDHPLPNRFDLATRDIADNAFQDAKMAKEKMSVLMDTKANLQKDHQPLALLVEGIVADLYQPSGMFNHLLNSSVGGTPVHPATNYQADLAQFKAEMVKEL
jgi:hypothetical protein